jgi:hypothetical protein
MCVYVYVSGPVTMSIVCYCTYTLFTHKAQVYYSLSNLYSMYKSIAEFIAVAPAIMIMAMSNVVIVVSLYMRVFNRFS